MMKHKNDDITIYTPGLPRRLFLLSLGIFMAIVHVVIFRQVGFSGTEGFLWLVIMGLVVLPLDAGFLWYGLLIMTQTRIIMSADGLELQRGGSHLFTTWDNIKCIEVWCTGRTFQKGFFLYHAVQPDVTGFVERIAFGQKTNFIPLNVIVNSPLYRDRIDLGRLAETDFGREVARYAPHLFEERKAKHDEA